MPHKKTSADSRRPQNRGASSLFILILAAILGVSASMSDAFPSPLAQTPEAFRDAAAASYAYDARSQLAQAGGDKSLDALCSSSYDYSCKYPNYSESGKLCGGGLEVGTSNVISRIRCNSDICM